MNLKEKTKEAKDYERVKNELCGLIHSYVKRHKEYESLYKSKFDAWLNQIIDEFRNIFAMEEYSITDNTSRYSGSDNHRTIKASLYDLEFEILIRVGTTEQIRFLQNKPKTEEKNIIIKPTIKKYYIKKITIELDESSKNYGNKTASIMSLSSLENYYERIKEAQYSISEMNNFIYEIKNELDLLDESFEIVNNSIFKSIFVLSDKNGGEQKDTKKEFEKLEEFIEML